MLAVSLMVLFGHLVAVQPFGSITQTLKFLFSEYGFSAVRVYGVLEVECTFAHDFLHCGEVVQGYLV